MTKVNKKQAKKFLENIGKKDKVAVVHHDDLDGFSSGVLFYNYAKSKGAKVKNFFGGYGLDAKKLLKKLEKYNIILISDLGPDFVKILNPVLSKREVLYTDHHPAEKGVSKNVLELRTVDEGYFPSSRTVFELTELDQWKGVMGTMGDMGHKYPENDKFLKDFFKHEKISMKKFLEETVFTYNKYITYNHRKPQKAFNFLARVKTYKDLYRIKKKTQVIEDEIQKHIKLFKLLKEDFGKIKLYNFNSEYPVKSTVASITGLNYPKSAVLFTIEKGKYASISGRNQGGNINVRELLQECTKDLDGAIAGGHDKAAGAKIKKKDFKKFKDNLKEYSKKLK